MNELNSPSTTRMLVRAFTLSILLWTGLIVLHGWFLGSGGIGRVLQAMNPVAGILVYLAAGAAVGVLDRVFQGWSGSDLARGARAGIISWIAGGILLYGYAIPGLSKIPMIPFAWHTTAFEGYFNGYTFSGLSIAAGVVLGFVQGWLQTTGSSRSGWRRKGWVVYSMFAGGAAWAFVPLGTIGSN
jgi:hypothetical protein